MIIQKLSKLICSKDLDEQQLKNILKSFVEIQVENDSRNIDEIIKDLIISSISDIDEVSNYTDMNIEQKKYDIDYFKQKYEKRFGNNSNDVILGLLQFDEFMLDMENIIDLYFNVRYEEINDKYFDTMVNYFILVFGREMTVYEYKNMYRLSQENKFNEVIDTYNTIYITKFKLSTNLYKLFTNEELDIHYFCKTFYEFLEFSEDVFTEKVTNVLINTELYEKNMMIKIQTIYQKNFEKSILESDVQYFYEFVFEKNLHLQDEKLPKLITE